MEENNQQTTDTGSQIQDQVDDWSGAQADFLADKGIDPAKVLGKKEDEDEQTKSEKTDEEKAAEAANSDGKKSDEEQGAGDDSKKKTGSDEKTDPNDDPNLEQEDEYGPQREARAIQRQIEIDTKEVQADVKKELYPDFSDDILDDQGKAMKTPRDVMNHINPNTGKRFTEEEATAWLFAAQKHKDAERAEMTERVEHVADVMITQRDDAIYIKSKYGKLLAQLPELRKEIWADYKDTLVVDGKTGLIVDAPLSLKRFFERALRPYAQYAAELEAKNPTKPADQQGAPAEKKSTQTDAQRKQTHADREDITSAGGGSVEDPEEKAWADAARKHYEGK